VSNTTAVRCVGLRQAFGETVAVDGLDLEVATGEVFGLLGPNGAGKTTTIRLITTLLPAPPGTITVLGLDVARRRMGVRRLLGYLPQQLSADATLTGRENVGLFARLYDVPRRERAAQVQAVLDAVDLGDVADRLAKTYSGGMIRRLELAQALVSAPRVLILDEPTVGLDPNQIRETRALIRELGRERTVLLSTHILSEVEAIASRVIILREGRIVAAETRETLAGRVAGARRVIVELAAGEQGRATEMFRAVAGVGAVAPVDETHLALALADGVVDDSAVREAIFRAAAGAGVALRELRLEAPSLEELFARATAGNGEQPA
jgi:ABC-2 type transport system ATP-binding protein